MNAFAKLKLTGELNTLKADMAAMGAFQKLKATKRVGEIAMLLGGGQAPTSNEAMVADYKVRLTTEDPRKDATETVPDDWFIVNAARPIMGNVMWNGDFLAGRFYAAIDPKSEFATSNLDTDHKLDARLVKALDKKTVVNLYLNTLPEKIRPRIIERLKDDSLDDMYVEVNWSKINDLPYGEFKALLAKAQENDIVAEILGGAAESYKRAETLPEEQANLVRLFPILTKFVDAAKARGFHAVIGWGGARASNKANGSAFPEISLLVDGEYKDKIVVRQWIDGKYHVFAIYAASEGNFNAAFDEAEKQAPVETSSEETLPTPTKYRTGKEGSNIQLETNQLHLLGEAEITSLGSENIYIRKDGLNYYCKVMTTERYAQGEWDFAAYPEGKDDTGQNDTVVEPTSNPLYQSVIDGDEVTTSLIEQVLEQAKTEADPASNAQLTQAVEIIRKKVIELAGA